MSKLNNDNLVAAINDVLKYSKETKVRKFTETVELQIGLKNYDPAREKRFAGSVVVPHKTKTAIKVMVIGDQQHVDECTALGIEVMDAEGLKKFKKDKKLVKKWAKGYDAFLASDSLIRQIPRLLGPQLNKMGKFPSPLGHDVPVNIKIEELNRTVKFQMKKVLCLGVAVGTVELDQAALHQNLVLSINTLISLLKKGWQNVASLHIKSSMGPVHRIY
uniref:Ribosomal protein n=1 Tax=Arcella intermedia TaxID=1963864 RepID=A0A6B2LIK7_9EUKA|eukprot:TRINITY_DN23173_c0_g1_i1.p1 TRINITY_DN23173_c0_g1~~TRINITY_DN23173_c0_g1_i1.p1  ORF type:complete len:218 (+),score=41.76 TRINITY_DN23173_c0_g1_i1:132-785(+)